jgi:hypothetical protein
MSKGKKNSLRTRFSGTAVKRQDPPFRSWEKSNSEWNAKLHA